MIKRRILPATSDFETLAFFRKLMTTNSTPEPYLFSIDSSHDDNHNVEVIMLGEFEYLLIAASIRLGDDAYGAAIREELQTTTGRNCSIGALYTTLERLENKGFVKTWMGEATSQRGGRPKRMVQVTAKGVQAAKEFYEVITRVSRGIRWAANLTVKLL